MSKYSQTLKITFKRANWLHLQHGCVYLKQIKTKINNLLLKAYELFSNVSNDIVWFDFQDVEVNGFRKWSAFSDSDNISFLDSESGGTMSREILMSLFVSVIFFDVMEIISSDNDGVSHLSGDN